MESGRKNVECNFTHAVPSISYLKERAKLARTMHTTAVFTDGLTYTIARPPNLMEYLVDASTETDNIEDYDFGDINTSMEVDSQDKSERMEESLNNINPEPLTIPVSRPLELDDQIDSLGLDGFNGFESIFPSRKDKKSYKNDFRRLDGINSAPPLPKPKPKSQELFAPIILSSPKPAFDVSFINHQNENSEDGNNKKKLDFSSTVSLPHLTNSLFSHDPTLCTGMPWPPSSWEEGPRRSAFLPYKFLTNLQRGNMTSNETLSSCEEFSFYEKAGRGDLSVEDVEAVEDVNETDCNGLTALMWSAAYGQTPTVKMLINEKANIHLRGKNNETALHLASAGGHYRVIAVLLANGARIHAVDKCGNTPLHYAVYGDHPHATNMLLESGADLFQLNNKGVKVYDLAINPKREDTRIVIDNFLKVAIIDENTLG